MRTTLGLGCLIVLGTVISGCATESGEQAAAQVTARFLDAANRGDTTAACALLTPTVQQDLAASDGQPCPQSLPLDRLRGNVEQAAVWSSWAQVTTDQGAIFLTEFEAGWLITAAGCQPNGDAPYSCVVGG